MRNYIILNGNNSNTISGLLIQSLPPISKPLMRTAIEEIDGRDGDIVTNLGYSAYDKEVSIGLYGTYDVDEVIKYFNDNSKGQVTFSNEPDKYYNYEIINQIDFERLIRFKTAIVTLHCQPFKYPTEETPVEINIQNITNEAEEMDLDNTADAPMTLALKGNTSQASDPTPDSPVDVNVVSGDNTIEICGKNLSYFSRKSANGITFDGNDITIENPTNYLYLDNWNMRNNTKYSGKTYTIYCLINGTKESKNCSLNISKTGSTYAFQYSFSSSTTSYNNVINVGTITLGENEVFTNIFLYLGNPLTANLNVKFMIVEGNYTSQTIGEFEPYTGNSQLISLGVENLFNSTLESGVVTNAGIAPTNTRIASNQFLKLKANTQYTISYETSNNVNQINISSFSTDDFPRASETGWQSVSTKDNRNYLTFTTSSNEYVLFSFRNSSDTTIATTDISNIQLEKGSKTNSYSEYGKTPIWLGEIGDYQDYFYPSNDRWYLHKEIGKVVLDGSENWFSQTQQSFYRYGLKIENMINKSSLSDTIISFANYFKSITFNNRHTQLQETTYLLCNNGDGEFYINTLTFTTLENFKTWLSTHNTDVYYVLATPTDTEITDTTLLEQLNNLEQAKSYDPITHITQNANDKPFILNATAVQKGSDTATVDNDGNIYSKPTLDIEGNGIVAIYLNGNQMFSVDLSNSSECIIDVTNLESYDPETNELMNRQVTGDYSKFILPVGENQVKVSGNVTKTTISDYVRWL